MSGESFDGDFEMSPKVGQPKMEFNATNMCRVQVAYNFQNWHLLQKVLPLARKYEKEGDGYFAQGQNLVWAALAHYDLYRASGKRLHKREGRRAHQRVKKWVASGSIMLLGPLRLLDAMESLCVTSAPLLEVDSAFDEAIAVLSDSKCIWFEAFGNERLAQLYLTEEVDEAKGTRYLDTSVSLFQRWGAFAKVNWLETRYSQPQV